MMTLYRLFKKAAKGDREGIVYILDRCYEKGLRSYQRLTNILRRHPDEQSKFIDKVRKSGSSIVDSLNKISDSKIDLRK